MPLVQNFDFSIQNREPEKGATLFAGRLRWYHVKKSFKRLSRGFYEVSETRTGTRCKLRMVMSGWFYFPPSVLLWL